MSNVRTRVPVNPTHVTRPGSAAASVPAEFSWSDPGQRNPLMLLCILSVALVVAYWDMFALTSAAWVEPLYSHGYIVPIFAVVLMWMRLEPFRSVLAGERWIGLGILASGLLIRLVASMFDMEPLDRLSFLVSLFGVFMMVGGWHVIRWAGPAIGFLVFMFPLPSILESTLLWNLQKIATICSTVTLQVIGVAAHRQGNIIVIDQMQLNVAEACSGLRMLTIFCALAVGMVFLVQRPWWDKFIILLSAVPIALLSNIVRITLTALLYMWVGQENPHVNKFVHDFSGLFMMPIGLGFLWVELQILSRLTIPEEMGRVQPVAARPRSPVPIR